MQKALIRNFNWLKLVLIVLVFYAFENYWSIKKALNTDEVKYEIIEFSHARYNRSNRYYMDVLFEEKEYRVELDKSTFDNKGKNLNLFYSNRKKDLFSAHSLMLARTILIGLIIII